MRNIEIKRIFEVKGFKAAYIFSFLIVIAFSFIMFRGLVVFEAYSECQETEIICRGIPFSDSCLGFESEEKNILEEDKCESVDEIENRCENLGSKICDTNNRSIGTKWGDQALVFGETCEAWSSEYSFSLRSC